jgi:hypothetical protein
MTIKIIGIAITTFLLLLIGNLLLFYLIISTAIERFVIPYFYNKGYSLIDYKWVGFLGTGDFKNEEMDFALFKTGLNSISIFSYIYYKDSDRTRRTTIKIDVVGLSIANVTYSYDI